MNASIHKFAFCLTACLLACVTGHAYEQDNWHEVFDISLTPTSSQYAGLCSYFDSGNGTEQLYVIDGWQSSAKIKVFDLNGSLAREINIASSLYYPKDLVLDSNGTIYIAEYYRVTCLENDGTLKWRLGKSSSSSSGSWGNGNGEFNNAMGIAIGPDGFLYVADKENHRIQVLDRNGTFIRKFSEQGTAPGTLSYPEDIESLSDGTLVVADSAYLSFYQPNGTFISRDNIGSKNVAISKSDKILSHSKLLEADGTTLVSSVYPGSNTHYTRSTFLRDGSIAYARSYYDGSSWQKHFVYQKVAYRTKGSSASNAIPQPAIRKITQRAGTNVLDVDFEIVDPDDSNATIGIIAYCGNDKVVPQTWVDGTGSKINSPITTNQVHRVSWDVKQDWNTSTGTIKFEILCQDGRTNKPVDLHFLTLPFPDGNMTISRSPLKDSDFQNYAKYLLAKGDAVLGSQEWQAILYNGSQILTPDDVVTGHCFNAFISDLGPGYRWATAAEVTKAREAATPGAVNNWTASVQVKPRNLPGKVNEYGFDVSTTSGYWVIKE